jgi:hypothetical protein
MTQRSFDNYQRLSRQEAKRHFSPLIFKRAWLPELFQKPMFTT